MSTHKAQRRAALTGAVLAGVLALSACSGDSGTDTDAGPDTAASSDGAAAPTEAGPGGDAAAATADVDNVPDIVAEVDGHQIAKDDFVGAYEAQFQQASRQAQMGGPPVDQAALKQQVLDGLITNQLLAQEAEEQELVASDEEVERRLDELANGNGMETEDFLAALEEQGLAEEDARTEVGNQISTEKLIEQEAPVEDPSEEELQERYDQIVEQQSPGGSGDDAAATGAPQTELPPFEEVRDQLAEQVRSEEQSAAVGSYVEELRAGAEITTHL